MVDMSGPTTVFIIGDPVTALLAAAGIRAAEALYAGYARAETLRGQHAVARDAAHAAEGAANRQGRAALERETQAAEARFEQLISLSEQLGAATQVRATRPVRPAADDLLALAAYTRALQGLAAELHGILLIEAARIQDENAEQRPVLIAPEGAVPPPELSVAQRLLARIAHLGPPPQDIATLAFELDGTPPGERATLLASELRRRIQVHVEALQQQLVQEATATIVRQSLKDLGYEVEDVADTLFVAGGVMHFRKPGWGDYMVRLRVEAHGGAANFNVIRAIDAGAGSDNERSVLDHIAEDRWCAEFPALLDALDVRGVRMSVTRRLEAGEMPVQLVERERLPRFTEDDAPASATKPLARKLQ